MTGAGDSNNLQAVVKSIVMEWIPETSDHTGIFSYDVKTAVEQHKKLDRGMNCRILFLLIHCNKGMMGYGNSYSSQKEVRELAAEFEVDHQLIDAEVRLELSDKKYNYLHEAYLKAVQEDRDNAKTPNLFSANWQGVD
jgi:hypothetical protein